MLSFTRIFIYTCCIRRYMYPRQNWPVYSYLMDKINKKTGIYSTKFNTIYKKLLHITNLTRSSPRNMPLVRRKYRQIRKTSLSLPVQNPTLDPKMSCTLTVPSWPSSSLAAQRPLRGLTFIRRGIESFTEFVYSTVIVLYLLVAVVAAVLHQFPQLRQATAEPSRPIVHRVRHPARHTAPLLQENGVQNFKQGFFFHQKFKLTSIEK